MQTNSRILDEIVQHTFNIAHKENMQYGDVVKEITNKLKRSKAIVDKYTLYDLYVKKKLTQQKIAEIYNVSASAISYYCKLYKLKSKSRRWTKEEIEYLEDYLGTRSVNAIAKRLKRTPKAVVTKAQKIGLGKINYLSDKLNARELGRAIGTDGKTIAKWINHKGLKAEKKRISRERMFWRIDIDEFWKFAYENKNLIKWSRLKKNSLGREPAWVDDVRTEHSNNKKYKKWKRKEDEILTMYWNSGKDPREISKILNRTKDAVIRRAARLNLKRRKIVLKWTQYEDDLLIKYYFDGYLDKEIAIELGRSASNITWRKYELMKKGKIKPIDIKKHRKNRNIVSIDFNKNTVTL